ncbi:fasciclin domain-containing protein [Nodularia spumigena]|uniref:fasciclin domain-containing protein n=1 Tax=Nodularia spumigena TaxID=70799 RepID=UPI00232E2BAD|nr:S-layer homology domain-containing protein [Nodularia spumigena]MDB9356087.1 S-layer homology domain-containing protein [Nodularia spumigena CS-587/03]MDB9324294.1 S-layer homology domain-containing protein [Nodularia spumigena CS-591/07A]MDB9331975.1 S-layer homology domain-containing protein [Nodularia spumigena CS-591/04]MDB9337931.1 S-layer homology domain-containing protein [Nodularia spumigena CS-589/07]MDB9346505.1 S-layer homology domain-containing protein [Nodularia spumigena CS-58
MIRFWRWTSASTSLLALGVTFATINPIIVSGQSSIPITPSPALAANLSDISSDYWASPFIQALATRNIISGFPDGTFRPNQPVSRAEFAAMIQSAFNQQPIRQISSQGFRDVPAGLWASSAIKEAYETGFMSGYPGNLFLPNQQIRKVEAIVALTTGLGLQTSDNSLGVVNTYYTDASAIPRYALDNVAAATQANIVVNYPNVSRLNPLDPLTRAEASAILYQALVRQGQMQALTSNVAANNYIVGAAQQTSTAQDIVSIAAASESFRSLTSLLQTAGLAGILQQPGPYTVFAPTDAAFAALPAGTLEELQQPENRELLIKILRYHVVPGEVTANQLSDGELRTFEDVPVNIQVDRATNQIAVNDANVIQPNVQASNGVIHVINEVLIPPNLGVTQEPPAETTPGIAAGTTTRGGSSYVGVAGNIGIAGDSTLSESNYALISKIGLTNTISVRPSVVFGGDTLFLVPITLDFAPRSADPLGGEQLSISPFLGGGVAFGSGGDSDFGFLLTGGVDLPLANRFTATGTVNATFLDSTDVGLFLGIGYNF